MNLKKIFAIGILISSLTFFVSCSKENKEGEFDKNQNSPKMNNVPQSYAKVYPFVSVQQPVGKKAPDFLWNINGNNVRFSEFTKGKYVLLNFWGTWCPPCRAELPDLITISKEMADKNLMVIGIALERSQSVNEAIGLVSQFWDNIQMNYPVIIGTNELTDAFGGINAVPTTFLVNNSGEIVSRFEGGRTKEAFMDEINKMMKK